ncbi:acyl-CoA dehydrogenase [Polaromonas sp. AET17H-212]|uniref:acyl-CoA dehydrogenase n=1 Tax=Polaromonas sp. AET17H-212 TaxID=1977061 RepID=UPI000BBC4285|nr:acyl-CoA dehydrogenase [Polaromonas sp. AET17H-212]
MIDLSARIDAFTEEQQMIRDSAASFYAKDSDYHRVRAQRGQAPGYSTDVWREMASLGWLGLRLPEKFDGSDTSFSQTVLLLEQMGRGLAPEPLTAVALVAGGAILYGDNEPLKSRVLPRLASGEFTSALAWQEQAASQRLEPVAVVATQKDGKTVLNGAKCFVPVGDAADAFIVSAKTQKGTALYLIDKGTPGLSVQSKLRVDGGFWSELRLDNVNVESDHTVASESVGAAVLERVIDEGRIAASAELVGVMTRALEISVEYIKIREQFGRPVGSFQALQHRAVDLLILTELSRSVLLQNAALFDTTVDPVQRAVAASQAKARCSDAALKVVKGCVQLHGGIGYTDECNIGLFLKKAMVLAAWLGSADEHRRRYSKLAAEEGEGCDSGGAEDGAMASKRQWIEENFPQEFRFPPDRLNASKTETWHRKLYEMGWAAPGWPKEHGGMGLSAYEQVQLQEEFDRVGMNIVPNFGVVMLGPLLIRYGTEEQKRTYLPKILSGETRWCQGYSEPGAGSDLAGLRMTAVLEGKHFVVNGQKTWTSFAYEADKIFLLVRTDKTTKKQKGISFLLADMDSPGITVRRITNLTGNADFCEVFFENVKVPKENLVGNINEGWTMAKSLLGSERIMLGNPRLAKYPLKLLREYARSRGLFDEPVFRAKFVELQLDIEDLSVAFVRFADVLRRGKELGAEVSMLKVWITETFQRVTDLIVETCAETATIDDTLVLGERARLHPANLYFTSRPATIYGGSSEIQRNILAKAVLGLPA